MWWLFALICVTVSASTGLTFDPLQSGEFGVLLPLSVAPVGPWDGNDTFVGEAAFAVMCGCATLNQQGLFGERELTPVFRDTSWKSGPTILSTEELVGLPSRNCTQLGLDAAFCGVHPVPLVAGPLDDPTTIDANKLLGAHDIAQVGSFILEPTVPYPDVFNRILYDARWEMEAIVDVLQHFGWDRLAIIALDSRWDLVYNLQRLITNTTINIVSTQIAAGDKSIEAARRALQATRLAEGKIILVHGDTWFGGTVMRAAVELGMHTSEYQYIATSVWAYTIHDFGRGDGFDFPENIVGTLGVFPVIEPTATAATYGAEFMGCLQSGNPDFARFAYLQPGLYYMAWSDLTRAVGFAFRDAFQLQDACHSAPTAPETLRLLQGLSSVATCDEANSKEKRTALLVELVRKQSFMGGVGPVAFDDNGSVYRKFVLLNKQRVEFGQYDIVAELDPASGSITSVSEQPIRESIAWRAEDTLVRWGEPPLDGTWSTQHEFVSVGDAAFVSIVALCGVGVAWAVFSVAHSVYHKDRAIIRMSSPNIVR